MSEIKLDEQKSRIYKEINVKLLYDSNGISTEINGSFSSIFGWCLEFNDITFSSMDIFSIFSSLKKALYNNNNELFETKNIVVEFNCGGVNNEFYKHIINDFKSSTYYIYKTQICNGKYNNGYSVFYDGVTFVFFH